jgi:hypothetical protein
MTTSCKLPEPGGACMRGVSAKLKNVGALTSAARNFQKSSLKVKL